MISTNANMDMIIAISGICEAICRTVLFFVLWNQFVPLFPDKKNRDRRDISILAGIVIFTEVVRCLMNINGYQHWLFVLFVVVLVYVLWHKRENFRETIFTLILFANLVYLSYFVEDSIMHIVSQRIMDGIEQAEYWEAALVSKTAILVVMASGLIVLILVAWIFPFIILVIESIKINWYELCYLSVMNVAGIILTRIMIGIAVLYIDKYEKILVDAKPQLIWQLPLVAILLYLGELSAVLIWQKYSMARRQSEIYFVRALEEEAIRRRLDETERYYDQVRKVRHEMASHMTNIKAMAEQGLMDELSQYIVNIDDEIRAVEMRYSTGNPVTDVVINDRYRKAKEAGVSFSLSFAFDESWGIPVYDLSIVLGNILDNAINAAASADGNLRYINMRTVDRENVILLVCENGFDASREKPEKQDNFWHGIGLKNIEDIAERYNGTMNIKTEGNSFVITVMLKKNALL